MHRVASGFTIFEVLIVVAILAIVLGIGVSWFRVSNPQVYASSLRNLILQARFEAIRANEPVVVSWEPTLQEFVARVAGDAQNWCSGTGREINRTNARDLGRLTVSSTVTGTGSLVWIPSGQARDCQRGLFAEDVAEISDGRSQRTVVIGAAGRVEIR